MIHDPTKDKTLDIPVNSKLLTWAELEAETKRYQEELKRIKTRLRWAAIHGAGLFVLLIVGLILM
jgi:hypothetical protein